MDVKIRLEALKSAYEQQISALKEKLDTKEVDPEKRKAAMALYKQAAEDSRYIWDEIMELEGMVLVDSKEYEELLSTTTLKTKKGMMTPEQRNGKG